MDIRIEGFCEAAHEFKYPAVLLKSHYATTLIVDSYHRRFNHCNRETAVNEMSEMQAALRKATLAVPRMAPLPDARVTSRVNPFSFVGIDYFDPLLVAQGRDELKKWVVVFTYLTIIAIHLEIVSILSTELS